MNNIGKENAEIPIDLGKLFKYYLKNWRSFVLAVILSCTAALLITKFLITPQYRSSVTFYVNNASGMQQIDSISSSNLSTSMKLVRTYVNIIESNTVLNDVIEEGGLDCSPEYLREIMSSQQVEETEMFKLYVLHPDPERSAYIANTIALIAPQSISAIVEGSSTKIIDNATVPDRPYSPSLVKNLILSAAAGIFIVLVFQTLRYIFDMRLNDEDDINSYFSAPVLGVIPSFEANTGRMKKNKARRGSDKNV